MDTLSLGKWGEGFALDYLLAKGYSFVAQSVHSRFGEVDLIVKDMKHILFVEVKTRKNKNFAHAREFVSRAKQRKIITTANYWLSRYPSNLQPRFDVIEIYAAHGIKTKEPEIVHIENAFGV